jgi:hypothetical protein
LLCDYLPELVESWVTERRHLSRQINQLSDEWEEWTAKLKALEVKENVEW